MLSFMMLASLAGGCGGCVAGLAQGGAQVMVRGSLMKMALYREGYYEADADQTLAEVLVLKNRHGSMGTANARWIGAQTRFADVGIGYA